MDLQGFTVERAAGGGRVGLDVDALGFLRPATGQAGERQ